MTRSPSNGTFDRRVAYLLGYHWIFHGVGAPKERLADPALLRRVLVELPTRLGLAIVSEPQISSHTTNGIESVAGVVLLAESHLSLHAFVVQGVLHGDLFSCKEVDLGLARALVKEWYAVERFDEHVLERGGYRVDGGVV